MASPGRLEDTVGLAGALCAGVQHSSEVARTHERYSEDAGLRTETCIRRGSTGSQTDRSSMSRFLSSHQAGQALEADFSASLGVQLLVGEMLFKP